MDKYSLKGKKKSMLSNPRDINTFSTASEKQTYK